MSVPARALLIEQTSDPWVPVSVLDVPMEIETHPHAPRAVALNLKTQLFSLESRQPSRRAGSVLAAMRRLLAVGIERRRSSPALIGRHCNMTRPTGLLR